MNLGQVFVLITLSEQVVEQFDQVQPFESRTTQPAVVQVVTVDIDGSRFGSG
jgi:hypothetical protein